MKQKKSVKKIKCDTVFKSMPIQCTPMLEGKEAELFVQAARMNQFKKLTKKEIKQVRKDLKMIRDTFAHIEV